jgi:hypothetical protein
MSVTGYFAEINGHWVADAGWVTPGGVQPAGWICVRCGGHFADQDDPHRTNCPATAQAHGHELFTDPDDGLLYCRRCPLVAYDLADVASEPQCPMRLH